MFSISPWRVGVLIALALVALVWGIVSQDPAPVRGPVILDAPLEW
jgi:hypothetical protein